MVKYIENIPPQPFLGARFSGIQYIHLVLLQPSPECSHLAKLNSIYPFNTNSPFPPPTFPSPWQPPFCLPSLWIWSSSYLAKVESYSVLPAAPCSLRSAQCPPAHCSRSQNALPPEGCVSHCTYPPHSVYSPLCPQTLSMAIEKNTLWTLWTCMYSEVFGAHVILEAQSHRIVQTHGKYLRLAARGAEGVTGGTEARWGLGKRGNFWVVLSKWQEVRFESEEAGRGGHLAY